MARLNYNPALGDGGEKGSVVPGVCKFMIQGAIEKVFKSGNEGLEMRLLVKDREGHKEEAREVFVYSSGFAMQRLKKLITVVGLSFDPPPDSEELVGKTGIAAFERDDQQYLKIKEFMSPVQATAQKPAPRAPAAAPWPEQPKPRPAPHDYGPPPMSDSEAEAASAMVGEEVPF